MNKAPDFVMRDATGKWHVLECKGSQTSRDYQRKAMATAVAQKHAIQLVGTVKGEQLASSLFLGSENGHVKTHMLVVDPEEDDPLIRFTGRNADEMIVNADRLTVARAMGAIGLNDVAIEMSLPPDVDAESELLLPSERSRLRFSRTDRVTRATERVRARDLDAFDHGGKRYEGRVQTIEFPPANFDFPFRKVRVRQGVTPELVGEVSNVEMHIENRLDERIRPFVRSSGLASKADENYTSLSIGEVFYSDVEWIK